jgi:hypothetical protein
MSKEKGCGKRGLQECENKGASVAPHPTPGVFAKRVQNELKIHTMGIGREQKSEGVRTKHRGHGVRTKSTKEASGHGGGFCKKSVERFVRAQKKSGNQKKKPGGEELRGSRHIIPEKVR